MLVRGLTDLSDFDHLTGLSFFLVGNKHRQTVSSDFTTKEGTRSETAPSRATQLWPSIIFYFVDLVKGPRLLFISRIRVRPQLPLFFGGIKFLVNCQLSTPISFHLFWVFSSLAPVNQTKAEHPTMEKRGLG